MTRLGNKWREPWAYAVYKGEEYLFEGTKEEICKRLGIKENTFGFLRSNAYKKRETHLNNRRIIIRIDGEDKIWR